MPASASSSESSTLLGTPETGRWSLSEAADLPHVAAAAPLAPAQDAAQDESSLLRRVPRREQALLLGFGLVSLVVAGPGLSAPADCRSDPFPLTFGADTAVTMTVKTGRRCAVTSRPVSAAVGHLEIDGHPAHGQLQRRGRSGVIYSANPGYRGEDSFGFALTGHAPGSRGTAVIRVRVTVR